MQITLLLIGFIATVSALNERCSRVEDCPDGGSTCLNGFCRCWTDQGPRIAEIWSCSSDNTCAFSFPGHVCRISRECARTAGRLGYCQPIGALRAPQPVTLAPLLVPQAELKAETATMMTITIPTSTATTAGSSQTTGSSGATTTYRSVGGGYMGGAR